MINQIKRIAQGHLVNLPGWSTERKIVVIESDDWGSIRMVSRGTYEKMLSKGYRVDECPYNSFDALESNEDLQQLFEVLNAFKDKNGNPAIMTTNNIVANPDFEKIKSTGFQEYHYEPFTKTLGRYSGRDKVMDLYKEGVARKLIKPQFHGREHVNVNRWMEGLEAGDKLLLDAFDHNMFTVHKSGSINGRQSNLDAFGMGYDQERVDIEEIIQSGLNMFEELWGYRASSFIAPCYVWSPAIEKMLVENGIKYIQGTHVQRVPVEGEQLRIKKKYHLQGQKNKYAQRYLVRNVFFEPAEFVGKDCVGQAMNKINLAFKYKKPAVISSHRVNFIGSIWPENRSRNLEKLNRLLQLIVSNHPDVEFMSTDQLGKLMISEN